MFPQLGIYSSAGQMYSRKMRPIFHPSLSKFFDRSMDADTWSHMYHYDFSTTQLMGEKPMKTISVLCSALLLSLSLAVSADPIVIKLSHVVAESHVPLKRFEMNMNTIMHGLDEGRYLNPGEKTGRSPSFALHNFAN
jgi:hypothetical protein